MADTYQPDKASPRFIIAGKLMREFVILPSGEARIDLPGGNLLYASVGLAIWEPDPPPGMVARVGEDFPQEWLLEFERRGLDTRGVKVLPNTVDLRYFACYSDRATRITEDPLSHFARHGVTFPKILLGYQDKNTELDSRTRPSETSLRQIDFIPPYLDATAAHICPLDYLSHSLLPAVLRQAGFSLITLDPSPGYMNPVYRDTFPSLLTGLTAFMPSEEEVRNLYHGRVDDLWQMAEEMSSFGCEIVVIKRGERGQILYDRSTRSHWEVPSYPSRMVDPTGAGDAFCGGFLAGYRRTYDPLEACLHGNISASLVVEGKKAFYALDSLPGLAAARLDSLRQSVRKV
ncbi:MAG: carbohydrate kinase family protein [Anaerolineales bacterium]|nr:carbohydrate kinase family protein [Anaerolineales bacterium]